MDSYHKNAKEIRILIEVEKTKIAGNNNHTQDIIKSLRGSLDQYTKEREGHKCKISNCFWENQKTIQYNDWDTLVSNAVKQYFICIFKGKHQRNNKGNNSYIKGKNTVNHTHHIS